MSKLMLLIDDEPQGLSHLCRLNQDNIKAKIKAKRFLGIAGRAICLVFGCIEQSCRFVLREEGGAVVPLASEFVMVALQPMVPLSFSFDWNPAALSALLGAARLL